MDEHTKFVMELLASMANNKPAAQNYNNVVGLMSGLGQEGRALFEGTRTEQMYNAHEPVADSLMMIQNMMNPKGRVELEDSSNRPMIWYLIQKLYNTRKP